ncbi:MAG: hypothetical protein D6734_03175 [Candidatus Schekmanbacteria bacterium]|nr:MAG: hypothetical protein D6734_03175 [Candidatus Schekmanbacteria bacterium]
MTLKNEFVDYVKNEVGIPLVGVVAPEDYPSEDYERIAAVQRIFAKATPLSGGIDTVFQPKDFLPEAKSVIITGSPAYIEKVYTYEQCKRDLLGCAEATHVNTNYLQNNGERNAKIIDFLKDRGYQCFSLTAGGFPLKLMASKCGVGFYGKNAIIQHPKYGAWISLSGYITDADLEPDSPLDMDCGKCDLCMKACPTNALSTPYVCDMTKCIDFHLGHNKHFIPYEIRENCGNLLGEGCTICRDVCPKNKNLTPLEDFEVSMELMHPKMLDVLKISDEDWERGFAMTLMGFFLMDKKYLIRNAAIGLGNFQDERAVEPLGEILNAGPNKARGYAAWALGRIRGRKSRDLLNSALNNEEDEDIRDEIKFALEMLG